MSDSVERPGIANAELSEAEITPETVEARVKALLAALRSEDPGAFIQGPLDDATIDGHFNLIRVVGQAFEGLRVNSPSLFSAQRKPE